MRRFPAEPGFVAGSDTSEAAAESVRLDAGEMRARVLGYIRRVAATCDEIEVALGMRHQTASARIRELALLGRIVDSGIRRQTRSGRFAVVWSDADA